MKRNTTPEKVLNAINNKKLSVISVKAFKDSGDDEYEPDQFVEELEFLCESGYFAEMIDFKFDAVTNPVTLDIGRLNYCDVYMVIKLDIADGVTPQEIKDMLLYTDY